MKSIKVAGIIVLGQLLAMQQAFAGAPGCSEDPSLCNGVAVPEIDGSGAIIGICLVAGLVALIREKFYHN